ncbi:hypothetical protein DBR45_13310, partial [Pseudomonas sp. HMWF031]
MCYQKPTIFLKPLAIAIAILLGLQANVTHAEQDNSQNFDDGAQVYKSYCAACHQMDGSGVPGSFPPQKGHAVEMFNLETGITGRQYLVKVVNYGLTGSIEVNGIDYSGNMPAWKGALSDQQIADVLNFIVTSFGNDNQLQKPFLPYTANEINAIANEDISGTDVYRLRLSMIGQKPPNPANKVSDKSDALTLDEALSSPIYIAAQNSSQIERLPSLQVWEGVKGAHYDAITPDGSRLLVSGFKTGQVYIVDTGSGKILANLAAGDIAQGVKISPNGKLGFAVVPKKHSVTVIDMEKMTVIKQIKVGKEPHNTVFNADGSKAFVTLQGAGAIAVINMQHLIKENEISTPGIKTPHNIDISRDDKRLWLRDFTGKVGVLDIVSEKMLKVFKVGTGHGGIDVIPNSHLVVTGAISDSIISIIDTEKLKLVNTIEVGAGPHGVRASADGRFIFVSVTGENKITIIDSTTLTVVREQPINGRFPFWIAVQGNP